MNYQIKRSGLQEIIDSALEAMGVIDKDGSIIKKVNLAEFGRRTGLTRSQCRTLAAKGFRAGAHGRCGMRADTTVLSGFSEVIDGLLREGVTNSSVIYERLCNHGYSHGLTAVKNYIASHKNLIPAKRTHTNTAPRRSRRYSTSPGECFQMDWGFVHIKDAFSEMHRIACFTMICHHCGVSYIEFFPNARQENLFIGMLHAFMDMGIPKYVLTDNMRSVTTGRDAKGYPLFQVDYASFMDAVGFKTKLCKPYHPFTKGKVERLISYVKHNFCAARSYVNLTALNQEVRAWCVERSYHPRRWFDFIPADEHTSFCLVASRELVHDDTIAAYLCPRRRVSFDGFVCYEGRRFGVPYWHTGRVVRVNRDGNILHIYTEDLSRELVSHPITWSRADSFCEDQFDQTYLVELPSTPITTVMPAATQPKDESPLARFDFEGRISS